MLNLNNWKVINNVLYYKTLSVKLDKCGYKVTNLNGAVVYVSKSLEDACKKSVDNESEWCNIKHISIDVGFDKG